MSNYLQTVLNDSPARLYRLGEAAGATSAADLGSQNLPGTPAAGVVFGQPSLLLGENASTSAHVSGSGGIALPLTGLPNGASPWSIEALAFATAPGSNGNRGVILGFGQYTTHAMAEIQLYNNTPYLQIVLSCYGADIATSQQAGIAINTIYHVVGTYDGTHTSLYVNGVRQSQGSPVLALALSFASIGYGNSPPADRFIGNVSMAAIYTYALSATQIAAHSSAAFAFTGLLGSALAAAPYGQIALAAASYGQITLADALYANLQLSDREGV